jgi:uncharacterized membrane protein
MQYATRCFSLKSLVMPLSFRSSVAAISRCVCGGSALHKRTSARDTACIVHNRGGTTNLDEQEGVVEVRRDNSLPPKWFLCMCMHVVMKLLTNTPTHLHDRNGKTFVYVCVCRSKVVVSCRVVRVLVLPVSSHRPAILPVFGILVYSHVILRVLVLCRLNSSSVINTFRHTTYRGRVISSEIMSSCNLVFTTLIHVSV